VLVFKLEIKIVFSLLYRFNFLPERKKMIEVSCAIIISDSKILAVQRGRGSSHPWKWEFPGGKINPDETAAQCIIREIEEELQLRIEVQEQLEYIEFDYGPKQIRLIPFICRIAYGDLILTEHAAKYWFDFDQWQMIEWSGADREQILKNQERIRMEISYK
jgi:8-oxo-dGTP diphosphatase